MSEQNEPAPEESSNTPEPSAAPSSGGFDLGTVITQATQVVTDPVTFYRAMAKSGGIGEPLIFALVMGVATGAVLAVLSVIGLTGMGIAGVGAIVFMPIAFLIAGFIGAAVLFVIWKLMGSPEDYETAYRCVAYSTAIMPVASVLSVIPYIGTLVRIAWGIWLMIIASEVVHGRPKQTALLVFGILGGIGVIMGLNSEYTQRNISSKFEAQAEQLQQQFKGLEKLGVNEDGEVDPEKAGRAIGDFLRGIEEASRSAADEAEKSKE